jgi:hypothetical protein
VPGSGVEVSDGGGLLLSVQTRQSLLQLFESVAQAASSGLQQLSSFLGPSVHLQSPPMQPKALLQVLLEVVLLLLEEGSVELPSEDFLSSLLEQASANARVESTRARGRTVDMRKPPGEEAAAAALLARRISPFLA